jgi:hypothetical protein
MPSESYLLVSNISAESVGDAYVFSDKKQGAGYHRRSDGVHTAIYDVNDFFGVIKLQGTLELYPGENDWVDIDGTIIGLDNDSSVWTSIQPINFTGNFVWLRAAYSLQTGTIVQIRYNY